MKKVTNGYATKTDLKILGKNLEAEMKDMDSNLRGEMKDMDSNLRGEMKDMEKNIKDEMLNLKVEILGELQKMRDDDAAHKFSHMRINDEMQELQNSVESLKKGNSLPH